MTASARRMGVLSLLAVLAAIFLFENEDQSEFLVKAGIPTSKGELFGTIELELAYTRPSGASTAAAQ